MKKILIISFVFPPQYGVGGRRWAKFAKLLVRKGYDVQIICSKPFTEKESAWVSDTSEYQDRIHFVDFNYPKVLTGEVSNLKEKLLYRIHLRKNKNLIKGNYFDRTGRESKGFLNKVEGFIKFGYNNLVISAGPFNYLNQVLPLKKKYPMINLIADFRDPWTTNKMAFGFAELSSERLAIEQNKESEVIENYDKILSVSEEMNDHFKSLVSNENNKFLVVPNGFDSEDRKEFRQNPPSNKIRFVFTGTFYDKAAHVFEEFVTVLNKIKVKFPDFFDKVVFEFYGSMNSKIQSIAQSSSSIEINEPVSMDKAHEIISNSHGGMLFLTDDLTYSFSTKYFEYLLYHKKVLVFSRRGKTGEYVKDKGIGYAFFLGEMENGFHKLIQDYQDNKLIFLENFDLTSESIETRVNQIEKVLI